MVKLSVDQNQTIYTTRPYLFEIDLAKTDVEITLPRLTTESQAKAF